MSRGNCYFISNDMDELADITGIGAGLLEPHFDTLEVDYIRDESDEEAKQSLDWLMSMFKDCGAEVGTEKYPEDGNLVRYVIFNKAAKEEHFKDRFRKMKDMAVHMELEDFACTDPFDLRHLILDNYGDCVYQPYRYEYGENMDTFIREVNCGEKIYFSDTVCLLH